MRRFSPTATVVALTLMNVLFTVCPVAAQDDEGSRHAFGFAAGLNISNLHSEKDYLEDREAKLGIHLGVVYDYRFHAKWRLSTGLSYSQAGAKWKGSDDSYRLHYLALPVTVGYNLVEWAKVYAGPQLSFKLKDGGPGLYGDFNSVDVGGLVGLELMMTKRLGGALQYYQGFVYNSQLTYTTGPYPQNVDELKTDQNRIFQISLRYYILK